MTLFLLQSSQRLPPTWDGRASILRPASEAAHATNHLWWFMFSVAAIVWCLVTGFLIYTLVRSRNSGQNHARRDADNIPSSSDERVMRRAVTTATILTTLILVVFLVYDFRIGRATTLNGIPKNALVIDIVAHQWWWDITYTDPQPQRRLTTANEIHVPVGRPVVFRLKSRDVIHSFWVPNLSGKKDLIPGYTNTAWFKADTAGVYRGQCAEFCGHAHSNMAVVIVAEPAAQFETWYAQHLQTAVTPSTPVQQAGQNVFLNKPCAMCHTIQGTSAAARAGPDLTHVGSRMTLAAGMIPNTDAYLTAWVSNPQSVKPGVQMPTVPLTTEELAALVAYLRSLQ